MIFISNKELWLDGFAQFNACHVDDFNTYVDDQMKNKPFITGILFLLNKQNKKKSHWTNFYKTPSTSLYLVDGQINKILSFDYIKQCSCIDNTIYVWTGDVVTYQHAVTQLQKQHRQRFVKDYGT